MKKGDNTVKKSADINEDSTVSKIIHEIRQPLGAMSMLADLALDDMNGQPSEKRDDQIRKHLEMIIKQGQFCSHIMETMKNGLPSDGAAFEAVDLNQLIRETLNEIDLTKDATGITVRRDLKSDLPRVQGNPGMLHQLFANLFKNAVDALQNRDQKIISVSTRKSDQGVRVMIFDTGCGIPNKEQSKIFDSAYTTKGKHGMGIGLSICKDIINLHNGTITVQSEENIGTSFEITLPRRTMMESLEGEGE